VSWPISRLGEVISFIRGVTFTPEDQVEPFSEGSTVVMRTKNVQVAGLDQSDLIAVPSGFVRRKEQALREGDILVSSANSWELVGKASYVPKLTYEATAGGFISIVRAKETRVDSRYLYHWVACPATQHKIRHCGRQTTNISNLDVGRFQDLKIPLPPLPEQKRIAAILDKADAIRRKRQQAIQLADDFLRAVFLDMFGDVIEGAENVVRFSDVAVLDAPMVDPRVDEYIDLIHIGPDRIEKKIGKLLPALTAREEGLISKKFLFDDRYVLYSKIRPYLRKCAMAEGVGLCSADMYPVRPVEGVATKEFLWMLLLSDFFTAYTESLPARANIPKLNREELEAFTLSLPDYSRQLKFSSIVRATNIAGQRVVESAAYVDGAFESLSQKAFSGQL